MQSARHNSTLDDATILEFNSDALLSKLHEESEAQLDGQKKDAEQQLYIAAYLMSFMVVTSGITAKRTSRKGRGTAEAQLKYSLEMYSEAIVF